MDLCGRIAIRFLANIANPASVDLSMSRLSRDISHGLNFSVSRNLDLVATSADLISGCQFKDPPRACMTGSLILHLYPVACLDQHRVLIVGHLAVQAQGSRREVKARSAGSIPH